MYILNKKTGFVHQINNADVIAVCKKDGDHYVVSDEPIVTDPAVKFAPAQPEDKGGEPEDPGDNGEDPKDADPENGEAAPKKQTKEELEQMTVKDLREVAKAAGVQGYVNMNKETMIAVILETQGD